MARELFTLEPIEEAEEGKEELAQVQWILETFIPSTTALLESLEGKPRKSSVAGRPSRAMSDLTFERGMLHTFKSVTIRKPEIANPRQPPCGSEPRPTEEQEPVGFFANIARRMTQ